MTIYYLYVKKHSITNLKYLGYTSRKDYHSYSGSGKYWKLHLEKHGKTYSTEVLLETDSLDEIKKTGIFFSELWGIVRSSDWANLKKEEGDGGFDREYMKQSSLRKYGVSHHLKSEACLEKLRQTNLVKYGVEYSFHSAAAKSKFLEKYGVDNPLKVEEFRNKAKLTCINKFGFDNIMKNPEVAAKVSRLSRKTMSDPTWKQKQMIKCEHCELLISKGNYSRWHGQNCLSNPNFVLSKRNTELPKKRNMQTVQCPFCFVSGKGGNMTRHHFDNCLNHPSYITKPKIPRTRKLKVVTCPKCGTKGKGGNMSRYHFDNCKINHPAFHSPSQ